MLSRDEALDSAAALLRKVYPEKTDSLVMVPEKSVEYAYGWAMALDWKEHIETGDWLLSPITSVVVVPYDGGNAHFPPGAFPVDDDMARRASGSWPPRSKQP